MKEKEIQAIKEAILNEIEGYEFYNLAARQAASQEAGEAFRKLAQEEFLHVEWLQKLYKELEKGEDHSFELAFGSNSSPEIFQWGHVDREKPALALSVFGIGIQMERLSVEFYQNAARNTEVPEARKLYQKLARWEQVHLQQFEEQYVSLKEEWWNRQDFSPF